MYSHNQFENTESFYSTTPDKSNFICKTVKHVLMISDTRGFSKTVAEVSVLITIKG